MRKLKLKITSNAPRNYKDKLTLVCSIPGTSTHHYMLVPDIESPNLGKWSEELQCFVGTDKTTLHDNGIIGDVMARLDELMDTYTFSSGKELFDAFRGVVDNNVKKEVTLGEFLEMVTAEERGKTVGSSTNYQLYNTLLNKLRGVNEKKQTTFAPHRTTGRSYSIPP